MIPTPSSRRRQRAAWVAGIVACVLLALGVAAAGARSQRHHVSRIHLVEREVQVTFLDQGKRGITAGDRRIVASRISTPAGRPVGRFDADCVFTGVRGLFGGACHGTLTLPRGQIAAEFAFDAASSRARVVHQAITGGTDAFRGARGQFVVRQVAKGPTPFVVELVR